MTKIRSTAATWIAASALAIAFAPGCSGDDGTAPAKTAEDVGPADDAGEQPDAGGQADATSTPKDAGSTIDKCSCKGKQCGFIPGCSASCGACAAGMLCQNNFCVPKPVAKQLPFGAYCGAGDQCKMPGNNGTNAQWDAYYDCLDTSCETADCSGSLCTKKCTILKDEKLNHSGEDGKDGIEDPGADSECADAAEGNQGSEFSCVELRSEAELGQGSSSFAICRPGKTFKPCKANKECPTGEVCRLLYLYGEYQQRCQPAVKQPDGKPGKPFSHACNRNPAAGEVSLCRSDICFGLGCIEFCSDDNDCITAPGACKAGKCTDGRACKGDADCSAWKCDPGHKIYSNVDKTFSLCWPKSCELDGDCGDDFYCRLTYNGVKSVDGDPDPNDKTKLKLPGYENRCYRIAEGSAAKGEECDTWTGDDNDSFPKCGDPFRCENGVCGGLCKSDTDCPGNMMCGDREYGFDLTDPEDGVDDVLLPWAMCYAMPGADKSKPCWGQGDCAKGKYCRPITRQVDLPKGATPVSYKFVTRGYCVDSDPSKGNFGKHCGPQYGAKLCNSGSCFNTTSSNGNAQAGYCVDMCNSKYDCPDEVELYGFKYKSLCRSSLWAFNTTTDPRDDLYRPVCRPSSSNASLEDCAKTFKCADLTDACRAYPIAYGPDKPIKVEYFCTNNHNGNGGKPVVKQTGEACDLESNDYQCKGGYCMSDDKPGVGYCSQVCSKDSDCGTQDGMFCDTENMGFPGLAREDAAMAGKVPVCRKKKTCIPCSQDYHCAGDYACTNLGGAASLAKMRCAPTCDSDADCAKTDGGSKCLKQIDAAGKELAHKVCKPACAVPTP